MGLVSEKVEVKYTKYYKDKGFINNDNSNTILVDVTDLPYRSQILITIVCDICGKEAQIMYRDYYRAIHGKVNQKVVCYDKNCKYLKQCEFMADVIETQYDIKDNSYRNRDWLYNEYIVKNRYAPDIAVECGIDLRTLRRWINQHGLVSKNDENTINIDKDVLYDLYINKQKTTLEIANIIGCNDVTVGKKMREYGIKRYSRSYTFKRYYKDKGGLEKIIAFSNTLENKIKRSCIVRGIDESEFYGFLISENLRLRNSSKYFIWRKSGFERDNYICQCCGKRGGRLNAHHKENFADNPDLRFEINNGITLCENCHGFAIKGGFHNIYGCFYNNTEQLIEYIANKKLERVG